MTRFGDVDGALHGAIAEKACPGAVIEVGRRDGVTWRDAFGTLTYDPDSLGVTPDTVFDLASLTKVIATATLTMRAIDAGRLVLSDPVGRWLRDWRGADRETVSIADLLAHASGLTAYLPLYRDHTGRREFEHAICRLPLEYRPRTMSVYSDLGFILLGFILHDAQPATPGFTGVAGASDPASALGAQLAPVVASITSGPLTFNPPRAWRPTTAPTEQDSWRGRLLVGEVHDENAWALGGVAGHAGLFGTVGAVGAFARAVLRTLAGAAVLAEPPTMRTFIERAGIPGSSRALGWDTMLPTSSCGSRLSPTAIGHTGFTGTSLWIDWERELYIVLLANRVHPTRENERFREVRPLVHDAVMKELGY
jgi:CubicO group peptidase (beta-lactamase class C family)